MKSYEVNFDSIVGPTHHYGGLSFGNVASIAHTHQISNPKEAALQGLNKMLFLHRLGVKQAVLPPQERPYLQALRRLGFQGNEAQVLEAASNTSPELLSLCSSASAMWAANAATVSASSDTQDGRVHLTPANLFYQFHRSIEANTTEQTLRQIFSDSRFFACHCPLYSHPYFADEGAANHTRFRASQAKSGLTLFVYGKSYFKPSVIPKKYPPRQTLEASQAIARQHGLDPQLVIFAQQNPDAIDTGVFHNDVISVGHENVFLYHEEAFVNTSSVIQEISQKFLKQFGQPLILIPIQKRDVPLADAVSTYLFNSQIVSLEDQSMFLIAPQECAANAQVKALCEQILQDKNNPISQVTYLDLKQSMANGGGPACLRLRIVLNEQELHAVHQHILFDESLYERLRAWIEKHYRDRLTVEDFKDPQFLDESRSALDDLTQLLHFKKLYEFQA